MIGWKAFRYTGEKNLRFLFHTHNGSSVVPFNEWIEAKQRWVQDGNRSKKYRAGFHFFRRREDIGRFQKLTKGKYWILMVEVKDIWQKPNSSVKSWLARQIRVPYPFLVELTGIGNDPKIKS